ncbi:cysteine protease (plasmid) [Mycobacterium sp. JS623]|uniref:C1 family peptidase n=1 Tax=Mycobacterium sp. JS623 TaxID=212767 RepID=UPI0002A56A61|nr:C1 family peptidase [Mycobacterium sp. JS623]AGB26929.1 cysteine protease [Mycobacterium sp. JS623]
MSSTDQSPTISPASDIYQTFDFGYDPTVEEPITPAVPPRLAELPPAASVNTEWLPPVGKQTVPNCFVWSSVYGATTFWAAQSSGVAPTSPDRQAAPDYTYIQVEMQNDIAAGTCQGGKITDCMGWVEKNDGTASLAAAPNLSACGANWSAYGPGSQPIPPEAIFDLPEVDATELKGPDGLRNLRTVIASGMPLAYGTFLYTDFLSYNGSPDPYVGNGIWLINEKTKQRAGHCMLIIAYDNTKEAVLIQNSMGTSWGSDGFMWMAYSTLQTTAQGLGFYIPAGS